MELPSEIRAALARLGLAVSVVGGIAVWLGAATLDVPSLIFALAGLNAACALAIGRVTGGFRGDAAARSGPGDGEAGGGVWEILEETPYLRNIAALVVLAAFTQAVYDYVFKAEAARRYEASADLVSFFALFYLGIGVATFAVQNLTARRMLQRFGRLDTELCSRTNVFGILTAASACRLLFFTLAAD